MATGVPRMAAQQACARQVYALYGAVFFQGREGVLGTAGIKAAVSAQQGTNEVAVTADQPNEELLRYHELRHCCRIFSQWCCSDSRSIRPAMPAADERAITMRSTPGRVFRWSRNDSRTCRLMRLRKTAFGDTLRETVIPKRACDKPLAVQYTLNRASLFFLPARSTFV